MIKQKCLKRLQYENKRTVWENLIIIKTIIVISVGFKFHIELKYIKTIMQEGSKLN